MTFTQLDKISGDYLEKNGREAAYFLANRNTVNALIENCKNEQIWVSTVKIDGYPDRTYRAIEVRGTVVAWVPNTPKLADNEVRAVRSESITF